MSFLAHVGMTLMCPHGIPGQVVPGSPRVLVNGMPAASLADQFLIAGCPFTLPGGKPQPCVKVQWLVPAARVLINGNPAILQSSVGLCLSADQIPNGPPNLIPQTRVMGQ